MTQSSINTPPTHLSSLVTEDHTPWPHVTILRCDPPVPHGQCQGRCPQCLISADCAQSPSSHPVVTCWAPVITLHAPLLDSACLTRGQGRLSPDIRTAATLAMQARALTTVMMSWPGHLDGWNFQRFVNRWQVWKLNK